MAHFYVSTGSVASTAASLSSLLSEFDQQLETANDAVTRVVGASWNGRASETFGDSWQGMLSDAAIIRTALASLVTRMHVAEGTYETAESSRTGAARSAAVTVRSMTRAPVNTGGAAPKRD